MALTIAISISVSCSPGRKINTTCYEHWRITDNKVIGIADTTIALIEGKLNFDKSNSNYRTSLEVSLYSKKKKVASIYTDEEGKFRINAASGSYVLSFETSNQKVTVPALELGSGEMRKLEIEIGSIICLE